MKANDEKEPIVMDKHGEPWTPRAAGFVFFLFLTLLILTALASLIASVLKAGL